MTFLVGRDTYDAHVESFSGNGSTTAFTLANSTTTNASVVRINGVVQRNSTDFTVSGTTITFTTAPPNASNNVVVQYFGVGTLQVPTDASVTEAKMGSESVSEAKLKVSNSPTNGTFLQAQSGASGGLTWATAGWSFVSSATASSSANVEFTGFTTGYDWMVEGYAIKPATNAVKLTAVIGVSGPTYRTANYQSVSAGVYNGNTSAGDAVATALINISVGAGLGNDTNEFSVMNFVLLDPAASAKTFFRGTCTDHDGSGNIATGTFGGHNTASESIVALKFLYSSGNIASGEFKLYKRANA